MTDLDLNNSIELYYFIHRIIYFIFSLQNQPGTSTGKRGRRKVTDKENTESRSGQKKKRTIPSASALQEQSTSSTNENLENQASPSVPRDQGNMQVQNQARTNVKRNIKKRKHASPDA